MMNINVKKGIEEIQESINKNKMLNVQIEQLEHEYDINLEHIHYLSDDITKELKKKCTAIIDIKVRKKAIEIRMLKNIKFHELKDVSDIIGIDCENIRLYSVCEDEELYIDMIINF